MAFRVNRCKSYHSAILQRQLFQLNGVVTSRQRHWQRLADHAISGRGLCSLLVTSLAGVASPDLFQLSGSTA